MNIINARVVAYFKNGEKMLVDDNRDIWSAFFNVKNEIGKCLLIGSILQIEPSKPYEVVQSKSLWLHIPSLLINLHDRMYKLRANEKHINILSTPHIHSSRDGCYDLVCIVYTEYLLYRPFPQRHLALQPRWTYFVTIEVLSDRLKDQHMASY
ncbi:hypothetical protein QQP08_019241 [Theobroma cacao]|nr:hypothetical protein QQP08_019241 [Theobroma cacao]